MSNTDTTAHDETPDTGPIVEPKLIRGRHLVGVTAIIVVVVLVATYLLGRQTATTETRSDDDEQILQAEVVAQAVEFGDFLLEEQKKLIEELEGDDEKTEELELAQNLGYDDLLEDAGDDFTDDSDLAVQIHEIKDDNALPVRDDAGNIDENPSDDDIAAAEDESGDEIDDNSLVQVEIGYTSACIDLVKLDANGPSDQLSDGVLSWVTSGPCPVDSDSSSTTTSTAGGTTTSTGSEATTSTATEDGS